MIDRSDGAEREWLDRAITAITAEANRSADTHLLAMPLPEEWGIELYLKDESTHPTGSLKHRLARSLFLYALCNGQIREGTTIIEASSGSTAVSEAYFARMLGLPFVAVIPRSTSCQKIALIESYGGSCHFVDRADQAHEVSCELARETGGRFMDQFTYAEQATDWRGNNSIAASIFEQMAMERHPIPEWVVVGAGTGGTSATIGRYLRYRGHHTRLCVADPERSVFFDAWNESDWQRTSSESSRIEGIGRPKVEASFIPTIVERMARVPDAASIAAMRFLESRIGRHAGASTGTNLWAALHLVAEMRQAGRSGSIVTLLCDDGKRYDDTYYNDDWLREQGLDISPYVAALQRFSSTGQLRVS
ncbi:PLP-dependent cysteine synthase family protein [Flexivirga sp. B27]